MKIEEKAKKYKEEHPATLLGDTFIAEEAEQSYFDGANAVLDEIENIISLRYDELSTCELIEDKIKELKGE